MSHISNEKFLEELTSMSKLTTETGAVSVTFKRYNEGVNCFPSKKQQTVSVSNNKCLIRAVYKNKKISTIVAVNEVTKFNACISAVLRGSITYLERKQRKAKTASE